MSNDWFPVLTALIGIAVGAGLTFLREQIAVRQKDKRDNEIWHRDKRAEVVEKAVMFGSAIYPLIHPDHEKWKADMANTHFLMRLYCSPDTAAAFKSVSVGLVLVAEAGRADERILLVQGEGNKYLQTMGRNELGMDTEGVTHETAKARYLAALEAFRKAAGITD